MENNKFDCINVIPLVDIMLVLLTIVLTTSTLIASGSIPVTLPDASAAKSSELKVKTITIDKEGCIFLEDKKTDLTGIMAGMQFLDRSTPVIIRADKHLMLQVFVDVLSAVKKLNFKKVSLQTGVSG
jgi:biopolymer transport protein ExbD